MKLKRPILVGGLGLSASLWLLSIVGSSPLGHAVADGPGLLGVIAVGSSIWWLKKSTASPIALESPLALEPVDKTAVEAAIAQANKCLDTLTKELPKDANKSEPVQLQIQQQRKLMAEVLANTERKTLKLAVVGNKSVGKTALVAQLKESWAAEQVAAITEVTGESALPPIDTDLTLFVTAADLTHSELQRIQSLLKAGYRVQIAFNKQDQLAPLDRQSVIARIQTRVEDLDIGVSAIATQPSPIKVRRHQEDGTFEEFTEQLAPQLEKLTNRLSYLVEKETSALVLTTALRQAKALQASAQALLNTQRRSRAMPIVEQMQWIAGGSAFASPLPSLDLLASTAINGQMIIDLGAVYSQSFSMEQAKAAAGTLAELLVKLGLVELSTQALGSLLKAHAATYVAGGAVQGVSAAYLTRMVGISLIDFFEEQSYLAPEKRKFAFGEMGDRLQTLFKAAKQGSKLQNFVDQALTHLPTLPQTKTAIAK
ncbi:MAG: YcjF family protein [Phormidesmis sp.]